MPIYLIRQSARRHRRRHAERGRGTRLGGLDHSSAMPAALRRVVWLGMILPPGPRGDITDWSVLDAIEQVQELAPLDAVQRRQDLLAYIVL